MRLFFKFTSIDCFLPFFFIIRNNLNSSFHKGMLFSSGALYGVSFLFMTYLPFLLCLIFCIIKFTFFSVVCSRNNLLSSIPADIGTLSKLGILDLHSNQVVPHLLHVKVVNLFFASPRINTYPASSPTHIQK